MVLDLHSSIDEQVSIIIVHRDSPAYLNLCLQSITVNSVNNNYEIIVVDNASGKDSQDFLDAIEEEVKVVRNDRNIWWAAAANRGAAAAAKNSKFLIFLHHDVIVLSPHWIDMLVNVTDSHKSGMVGLDKKTYLLGDRNVDFIQEWCLLFTHQCWVDIGPFPEQLPQVGTTFLTTMKASNAGYNPQLMTNPICHHCGIFALDFNEYEKLAEQAMVEIPRLITHIQAQAI